MASDKLILYTSHVCPWAHRVHIALAELGLSVEEVHIDLTKPRTPEYLAINPRGLVPALSYNGEIIVESSIITNFLADLYPSHLVPVSNSPGGALQRARIARFVDAYISKFHTPLSAYYTAQPEDRAAIAEKTVAGAVNEVEPLLKDAAPFFGGSDKLTLAEALTASFAIRLKTFTRPEVSIFDNAVWTGLVEKAPNFVKWIEAVSAHPSVTGIYSSQEDYIIEKTKAKIAELTKKK